jgi:hypothetical protein
MSTDELRRLLDYPDDERHPLDLPAIVTRAERHRSRRRRGAAAGVVGVVVVAAAVVAAASLLGTGSGNQVHVGVPAAPKASEPAQAVEPTPITTSEDVVPATYEARAGERVDLGHGWQAWVDARSVCRSETTGTGSSAETIEPFGCRSTTDGNIGGVGIQSSAGPEGTMYSAVIPYAAARVEVVTGEQRRPATLVRFPELPGWTFYYLWSPDNHEPDGKAVAYDSAGNRLEP